jgi:hypothetical protein
LPVSRRTPFGLINHLKTMTYIFEKADFIGNIKNIILNAGNNIAKTIFKN